MAGVTEKLVGNMAACKREMIATAKFMQKQTSEIDARHDEVAKEIACLDAKLKADPGNAEISRKRDEYDHVREGLYAASEYGTGLVKQMAGQ